MKKTFFLLFVTMVAFGSQTLAQNVTFLYEGTAYGADDTIECTLDHGVMLSLEGFSLINNSSSEITLVFKVDYVEGANISVGGLCTAGGQCTMGSVSAAFTMSANETYEGISMEMMVPDEVEYGDYAVFRVSASRPNAFFMDENPYTWMRVRCSNAGILTAQPLTLQTWPNPTTDHVTIATGVAAGSNLLRVFDGMGRCVLEQRVEGASTDINTCQWAAGVYQCQLLKAGNVTGTATIVKQ